MSVMEPVLVKFEGATHTDDGKFILLKFGPHAPGYVVEHLLAMPVQEVLVLHLLRYQCWRQQ